MEIFNKTIYFAKNYIFFITFFLFYLQIQKTRYQKTNQLFDTQLTSLINN